MDHKHAVEVLAAIERAADVNALRAGGLRLWPLVRMDFWEQLLGPSDTPARPAPRSIVWPGEGALMAWRRWREIRRLPRAEALFFSRREDHTDRFPAGHYNRHTDPMIEFCRSRMSCLKIEAQSSAAASTLPRACSTQFVPLPQAGTRTTPARIEGAETLRTALAEIGEPLAFDEAKLRHEAAVLLQRRDAFLAILDRVKPRVVFVVCYYDRRVLPLVAACRQRGIPTVDIQHGKQGVYHGLYTHWTRWPSDGYELLPDFFWVWGEASRRHMASGRPAELPRHRPIVGGSRWLALWRRGAAFPLEAAETAWLAQARRAQRVILVTLQPLEPMLPPHLREALRRSPSDWLWLLRAHPRRRAKIPPLIAELNADGTGSYEGERASTVPLYALLRIADRHLTCWSSVAQEAPAFDVPTMIVHPSGQQLYAEEIAAGRFQYGATAESVLAWIAGEKCPVPPGEPYLEIADERAEAALATVLAGRPGVPHQAEAAATGAVVTQEPSAS